MIFEKKLAVPQEVKDMYPITAKMADTIKEKRKEINSVFEFFHCCLNFFYTRNRISICFGTAGKHHTA